MEYTGYESVSMHSTKKYRIENRRSKREVANGIAITAH
jgi:hypothetical protein